MRHLVLAIAAVAAVQTAFQLLIVDEYAPEYAAAVAVNAWPADTIIAVRGDLENTAVEPTKPTAVRVRYRRPVTRPASVRGSYRPAAPRVRSSLVAKSRPSRMDNTLLREEHVRDVDGIDGRPWIAKALPIIKKPYGWLKTLGSKLK